MTRMASSKLETSQHWLKTEGQGGKGMERKGTQKELSCVMCVDQLPTMNAVVYHKQAPIHF